MGEQRMSATDDDALLVARFVRGDVAAFDVLFQRYQDYVYHIAYGIVGNSEDARDLTQDVFLQVYKSLHRFRFGSRFATWLYRIAANRAIDQARSARQRRVVVNLQDPAVISLPSAPEDQPEVVVQRQETTEDVQSVLMRCTVGQRAILALRYYRNLSIEDIARTLGCSVTAAKVRLHRARAAFKQRYDETHGDAVPWTSERTTTDVPQAL